MQVNVVIGDLNAEAGNKFVSGLQDSGSPNKLFLSELMLQIPNR